MDIISSAFRRMASWCSFRVFIQKNWLYAVFLLLVYICPVFSQDNAYQGATAEEDWLHTALPSLLKIEHHILNIPLDKEVFIRLHKKNLRDHRPEAALLLLHGFTTATDLKLASRIAEKGYLVLGMDIRGHGGSGGEVNTSAAADDIPLIINKLRGKYPIIQTLPLLGVGISYGGVIINLAQYRYNIFHKAAVIAAPYDLGQYIDNRHPRIMRLQARYPLLVDIMAKIFMDAEEYAAMDKSISSHLTQSHFTRSHLSGHHRLSDRTNHPPLLRIRLDRGMLAFRTGTSTFRSFRGLLHDTVPETPMMPAERILYVTSPSDVVSGGDIESLEILSQKGSGSSLLVFEDFQHWPTREQLEEYIQEGMDAVIDFFSQPPTPEAAVSHRGQGSI